MHIGTRQYTHISFGDFEFNNPEFDVVKWLVEFFETAVFIL